MKPTIPYLERKFDEFNHLFFEGRMSRPRIVLSHARTYRGLCVYSRRTAPDGTVTHSDFCIRISVSTDLPEHEVEDTLIHEMIHYYIGVFALHDNAPHGHIFRSHMQRINREYGRHIVISHRSAASPAATPAAASPQSADSDSAGYASSYQPRRRSSTCVVAVLTLKDGRNAFKVLSRTINTIVSYYNRVCKSSEVKTVALYLTHHPYFSNFPHSGAAYCHVVSNPNFHSYLADAVRINCDGKNVAFTG